MRTRERRHLTLALTLWGVVIIIGPLIAFIAVEYVKNPEYNWSIVWTVILIVIPAFIFSILTGLAAGLGAYVARRMASSEAAAGGKSNLRLASSFGAGLGAMVVGTIPFGYLLSLFNGAPPVSVSFFLFVVLLFVLFGGFAALWVRRRQP